VYTALINSEKNDCRKYLSIYQVPVTNKLPIWRLRYAASRSTHSDRPIRMTSFADVSVGDIVPLTSLRGPLDRRQTCNFDRNILHKQLFRRRLQIQKEMHEWIQRKKSIFKFHTCEWTSLVTKCHKIRRLFAVGQGTCYTIVELYCMAFNCA